jgi:serine/threonine-protein kinase HipA
MTTIFLYAGAEASPSPLGLAYVNLRRGQLSTTFAYVHEYLSSERAFAIDPELPLQAGNWPAQHELPGCFMDAAPDRWGRNLINKRYPGKRLSNLDYLLGVSDITRQGALRFKTEQAGAFQYPDARVPKLIALSQLYEATKAIDDPHHAQEAVKYLLDAGSGSLGGARPKPSGLRLPL